MGATIGRPFFEEWQMAPVHRALIFRLFTVWILLSAMIGGVVLLRELNRIDKSLLDLAAAETMVLRKRHGPYLSAPSRDHIDQIRSEIASHISDGHFVIINLYDAEKRLMVSVKDTTKEQSIRSIEKTKPILLPGPNAQFRKFLDISSGQVFILVMVPLNEGPSFIAGHFEAVYKVDEATIKSIKSRLLLSLSHVIITIFITALVVYPVVILLNRQVLRATRDLSRANIGLLKSLGSAVAKRDSETNSHNYRVAILSSRLAEEIGLRKELVAGLINGSFLHDVGKIAIQDSILLKPGGLTSEETIIMRSHVKHGMDIVKHYQGLEAAASIIQHHHEKYDGSGYPAGTAGEEIPLPARIFALVDVFDALISKRPYKKAFGLEESLAIIRGGSGTHFDPRLVEPFCRIAAHDYSLLTASDDQSLDQRLDRLIEKYQDSLF